MHAPTQSHHHPHLDGIRGLMAWWVVLGHLCNYFGLTASSTGSILVRLITMTSIPVDIFICLSGYVIFASLSKGQNLSAYATSRFLRIYPAYFIVILIAIFTESIRMTGAHAMPWTFKTDDIAHVQVDQQSIQSYLSHILLHLTLLHGAVPDQILPGSGSKFISAAWSLSLEWQFYLVAPALFVAASRFRHYYIATIIALSVVKAGLFANGITFTFGAFLACKIEMFTLGMMTYMLCQHDRNDLRHTLSTCAFLAVVMAIGAFASPYPKSTVAAYVAWFSLATTLHPTTRQLAPQKLFIRWLSVKPLAFIGLRSYSTYLIHLPIIQLLSYAFLSAAALPVAPTLPFGVAFSGLVVVSTLVTSMVLFTYVENPAMEWAKQLNKRRSLTQQADGNVQLHN